MTSKTFVLKSASNLIIDGFPEQLVFRAGRDSCFSDLFGKDFDLFQRSGNTLSSVLGSVGRILSALARYEEDVAGFSHLHFVNCTAHGHGAGFIRNICPTLPETVNISDFQKHALSCSTQTAANAAQTVS